ncbi:hypothetical protein L2E82_12505 [Cichorium intybus]|uniref:Uncharacterized protein n=1 Tax=Cichorium intybus TaxID=13427 RepID=A0ACB9GH01_CICIN|nr:hypothetical protein L2E82_12505 [Cichorium intybus]
MARTAELGLLPAESTRRWEGWTGVTGDAEMVVADWRLGRRRVSNDVAKMAYSLSFGRCLYRRLDVARIPILAPNIFLSLSLNSISAFGNLTFTRTDSHASDPPPLSALTLEISDTDLVDFINVSNLYFVVRLTPDCTLQIATFFSAVAVSEQLNMEQTYGQVGRMDGTNG